MLLLDKLNEFNANYKSLIALKKEIETMLSDENLKSKMQTSFEALKSNLESSISSSLDEKSNETLKETMQSALNKVNELVIENIDETASKVALNLNLESISKNVANGFLEENKSNFEKTLCEVLKKDTSLQDLIENKKQEVSNATTNFLNLLSLIDAKKEFQDLTQSFLQNNKNEVFNHLDFKPILELIKTQKELKDLIKYASKEATTEMVGYENIQDAIIEALKNKGKEVFREVAEIQSLKELRFEAALHLQAISLQGELWNIQKALNALADVLIAKKRLEMLEKYPNTESFHKSFAVI